MNRAGPDDIPRIIGMIEALVKSVNGAQIVDRAHTGAVLTGLMRRDDAAVWVTGGGFLAGSISRSVISPEPVAVEHGWYAEDGSGLRLLRAFERWAREMGAVKVVLSTAPTGPDLSRLAYRQSELAWVK